MKKLLIIGCFIASFLLLTTSCVNSIEYTQIGSKTQEKINKQLEQTNEKPLISTIKLNVFENVRNLSNKILPTLDNICLSCADNPNALRCVVLFIKFTVFVAIQATYDLIVRPIAVIAPPIILDIIQFIQALLLTIIFNILLTAQMLNCTWAYG